MRQASQDAVTDKRVKFDFEVEFSNGGGIQGQDFRLDIEGESISDEDLAAYIVRDLRLLMVGTIRILNKEIIDEPHKRIEPSGELSSRAPLVDLSHTVRHGMITYMGLPGPLICDFLSREESKRHYAPGTEFQIGKIEMVANTGTYLDSPFHRFAAGKDLAELPLASVANLDAVVVRVPRGTRAIGRSYFLGLEARGKAILVHTGWDAHWGSDLYFTGHPFLTADAAEALAAAGAALVGIDSLNIDDIEDGTRPVHTQLLGAEIPVAEHLCGLEQLPEAGFRFFAVPVKIEAFGTFPVRAFAVLDR